MVFYLYEHLCEYRLTDGHFKKTFKSDFLLRCPHTENVEKKLGL